MPGMRKRYEAGFVALAAALSACAGASPDPAEIAASLPPPRVLDAEDERRVAAHVEDALEKLELELAIATRTRNSRFAVTQQAHLGRAWNFTLGDRVVDQVLTLLEIAKLDVGVHQSHEDVEITCSCFHDLAERGERVRGTS